DQDQQERKSRQHGAEWQWGSCNAASHDMRGKADADDSRNHPGDGDIESCKSSQNAQELGDQYQVRSHRGCRDQEPESEITCRRAVRDTTRELQEHANPPLVWLIPTTSAARLEAVADR